MSNIIKTSNFANDSAEYIATCIRESIDSSGTCVLCLAGGKTAIPVYEKLARMDIDWDKIYLTVGDERNVPLNDKESNFKGMYDSLISKVPVPAERVFKIETALGMEKAAETYEKDLIQLKKTLVRDYIFDVLLLGVGADGHTASLFPNSPALNVVDRLVAPNKVGNVISERITITYPAIASSKKIIFLSNDPSKKDALEKIWAGEDLPATKVDQMGDKVTWFVGQ